MYRVLGARADLGESHVASAALTAKRARQVEYFLIAYFVIDALAFAATFSGSALLRAIAAVWAVLRVIDIVQASVNTAIFDPIRGRGDNKVASQMRLTVLAIGNYIELIFCFATFYAAAGYVGKLTSQPYPTIDSWDALYFSALTQLTVSFGDIVPADGFRIVAPVQALLGLMFLVLIFARIISSLPRIGSVLKDGGHDA